MGEPMIESAEGIRTDATVGGRRITLDPIQLLPITLNIREVESTLPAGFQSAWGEVEIDGDALKLTAGAGLGSQWGTITFRGKCYVWSISELARAFLEAVSEESATPRADAGK